MTRDDEHTRLVGEQLAAFGRRLRGIRTDRRWSQRELGNCAGMQRSQISEIEHGKNVTLDALWRVAEAFYLHWADLVDDRADAELPDQIPIPFERQLADFGQRTYQARRLQRISQPVLATRTGVSHAVISEVEHGANTTLDTLFRLAAGLNVHAAVLLDDRDPSLLRPEQGCPLNCAHSSGHESAAVTTSADRTG
jgi:transcriptional regulator with XRE-family HTH domain